MKFLRENIGGVVIGLIAIILFVAILITLFYMAFVAGVS